VEIGISLDTSGDKSIYRQDQLLEDSALGQSQWNDKSYWGWSSAFASASQRGLNNCIVDVAKLAELLSAVKEGKMALKEAVNEYEKEMFPRGAQEVMASRGNALALWNWDQMMESPLSRRGCKLEIKERYFVLGEKAAWFLVMMQGVY
jgi:hypothetical protein